MDFSDLVGGGSYRCRGPENFNYVLGAMQSDGLKKYSVKLKVIYHKLLKRFKKGTKAKLKKLGDLIDLPLRLLESN